METNSQTSTAARSGAVDYAAALRQYNRYGRDRRVVEEFYRGMIEDMRVTQEKEMAQLRETMQQTIDGLTAQISSLSGVAQIKNNKRQILTKNLLNEFI